jgi:hypothetical protein
MVQEDVPVDAVKPTEARAPVLVPRGRPAPVTLAMVILSAEVALSLLAGSALLIAATTVPAAFINHAVEAVGASSPDAMANIDAIGNAIRAVLLGGAVVTLLLSVAAAALVVPVARGSWTARLAAYALAVAAGCAALGSASYTAFGQRVDWVGAVGQGGTGLAASVGQAYGDAMPSWLVGSIGGLTDLQVLGYIAVSVLLALPVVRPYFRRAGAQPGNVSSDA